VDALETHPGVAGPVRLRDLETGEEKVLEADPGMLLRYRREFDLHLARVERYCIDAEYGFARIDTAVPFDASVLSILRKGRILK